MYHIARKALMAALVILFPVIMAFLVYSHGITVPYSDQWALVPLLQKAHYGKLGITDLWVQYNDHRIFFPKVIMLALASLSDWNLYYELCANFAMALLTLLILTALLRRSLGGDFSHWYTVLLSGLVFSPVQYENFLMGWQMPIFLSNIAFLAAIYCVFRFSGLKWIATASSAAIVASSSFLTGILSWPATLLALLLHPRRRIRDFLIMLVAAALFLAFYFHGYTMQADPPLIFPWEAPSRFLLYVFSYIGSALFIGTYPVSFALGLTITAVFMALSVQTLRSGAKLQVSLLPWIAIGLYAIMSAAATASGRLGLGPEQAMADRYTTISMMLSVATLALAIRHVRDLYIKNKQLRGRLSAIVATCIVALTVLYVQTYRNALINMGRWTAPVNASAVCLENIETADEACLEVLHHDTTVVKQGVSVLKDIGYR